MPLIQCDIRRGRTDEQRNKLMRDLARIVAEVTGAPLETVAGVIRELPGPHTYEGGEPSPEYLPGPGGLDLSGPVEFANRTASQER